MNLEIQTFDTGYGGANFTAMYLLKLREGYAVVETGTAPGIPGFLEKAEKQGISLDQIRWIILTHIHLDHAGGASLLLKSCKNAKIFVHPRGARHLIDPSRLVASAKQVYGESEFARLYGTIEAIPEGRVRTFQDQEVFADQGQDVFRFHHTRGHANHHFVVEWIPERTLFTGDTFGLVYPEIQELARRQGRALYAIPSTSPTDFDAEEAILSIDRILALRARDFYPTHYGQIFDFAETARQLKDWIWVSKLLQDQARSELQAGSSFEEVCSRLEKKLLENLNRNWPSCPDRVVEILALDFKLNAQGITFSASKS
ncbi:MAG: MBL fold metallo-hydrolase [Bdellovibrionales bacterium]|nr:MBL fold metallo-hydrolase [Bdellovibrionales bacterium]